MRQIRRSLARLAFVQKTESGRWGWDRLKMIRQMEKKEEKNAAGQSARAAGYWKEV
ncbi:MAG: hypothetical protein LKE44_11120 [Eubacterium sp.]|jgi:hypothetical protein|nr:hypothetical protein [Eubacterium sp.]